MVDGEVAAPFEDAAGLSELGQAGIGVEAERAAINRSLRNVPALPAEGDAARTADRDSAVRTAGDRALRMESDRLAGVAEKHQQGARVERHRSGNVGRMQLQLPVLGDRDLGALVGLQPGRDRDACAELQPPNVNEGAAVVAARQPVADLARVDVQGAVVDDPAAAAQVDRAAVPKPGGVVTDQVALKRLRCGPVDREPEAAARDRGRAGAALGASGPVEARDGGRA